MSIADPISLTTHRSAWLEQDESPSSFGRLDENIETDVLVIGGGITGLSVAYELLRRGRRVVVCEANSIGSGTTGGSSAHLDAHPEMMPKQLINQLGLDNAKQYVQWRLAAIDTIHRVAQGQCDFRRLPGYQYTESDKRCDEYRQQCDAARQLGLDAEYLDSVPISMAVCGYRVADMARFDCVAYLRELSARVSEMGGKIFEGTQVESPTESNPVSLHAGDHEIRFSDVVTATHCHFGGAMHLYGLTVPYQSYLLTARVAQPIEDGLYWDDSDPYFYVRRFDEQGDLILVGGCDHHTGDGDEVAAFERLEDWTRKRFVVDRFHSRWSAELFESVDGLPFIGKAPGTENVYLVTGLSGVGLTLGTAAGELIASLIERGEHPLADTVSPSRMSASSLPTVISEQMPAAKNYLEHVLPAHEVDPGELTAGQGAVGNVDGEFVAICRDRQGQLHRHHPTCPHMGGVVHWNEAEQTWDCPAHGGRFCGDGKRLYGPPESDLKVPDPD